MTEQAVQEKTGREKTGWSVEAFAEFWANPDPALVAALVTDDVIGHWPGTDVPVSGIEDYTRAIEQILTVAPGMHLEVAEHATNGDNTFVRWIMHATGADGPFTLSGIDRVKLRGGLVCENIIRFDTAHLRALLTGKPAST
jgi:ketosteroid isomerase-like protein